MASVIFSTLAWLLSPLWWLLSWVLSPVPLAALAVAIVLGYRYYTKDFDYWKSKGVPGPPAKFPWGHGFSTRSHGGRFPVTEFEDWLYNKHGGKKYCGYIELKRPVLYVGDPDLIRAITVKDFDHFTDRRDLAVSKVIEKMLSRLNGQEWKETRAVMSPSFSSSKLKAMHQLCLDNAAKLNQFLREEMQRKGEVQLKDALGRFTMDNIASCGFGVNCNSFVDPNTEFATHASTLFKPPSGYAMFRLMVIMLFPKWIGDCLPDPGKAATDFFQRVVNKTVAHREQHGSEQRDFLQLLLETKNKDGQRALSDSSIVAQSVLFFLAGYDTTASLLTFAGYALATSPDIQGAVQREIDEVLAKHDGRLTYDAVSEMTYLDRVLAETLRLYPTASRLERRCSKDYILPGTDVLVKRGMIVGMPVFTLHRDPDHYPDPLRFDPDRFLPEEKAKRHPCAYIPFGSGPRNCIAMRFALFEAKVAMIAVLRENSLKPGSSTPPPPLPHDPYAFVLRPKDPLFLKVVPRSGDEA
ncbi:cytochrome P450 3A31-like [Pollicipes pollicipes]|uniref:cytochrome P450 3A31-like n=1 Tax=Pollicipes pollicipes TaxID=41117 RepID=UPI001884F470|nr:cytochrome P450 3A31-like [Pollicipes pollicipes]